jgi:GT2 family glycosyltransferase
MKPIEIIVPVYNAHDPLAICLKSLFANLEAGHPVQIVDDASTDSRIQPLLAAYADRPGVSIHNQATNLGFVRTVNQAMQRSPHHVLLLNSDTIVTDGWLERIEYCAASDPHIATITPFSNNAEICSFPNFCEPNPPPADPDHLARVFRQTGKPEYLDLPTAVGFCMFIRRQALDELGAFDAETFGQGYGEENDFCLRAHAAGWRNVLCDDAFVVHLGRQSFADLGLEPGGENLARLLLRYPHYNELVADFIRRDPIKTRRDQLIKAVEGAG